jgi:hypothetical protein
MFWLIIYKRNREDIDSYKGKLWLVLLLSVLELLLKGPLLARVVRLLRVIILVLVLAS